MTKKMRRHNKSVRQIWHWLYLRFTFYWAEDTTSAGHCWLIKDGYTSRVVSTIYRQRTKVQSWPSLWTCKLIDQPKSALISHYNTPQLHFPLITLIRFLVAALKQAAGVMTCFIKPPRHCDKTFSYMAALFYA